MGISENWRVGQWRVARRTAPWVINCSHERGSLDYIGLARLNSPSDFSAKLDYLQVIPEELIPRL